MRPQRVFPMIAYEDAGAAADWLCEAFGFTERGERYMTEDGMVGHAELELGGEVVMLATPNREYQSPKRHRETCEQARKWSEVPYVMDGVLVEVSDVDAHFARANEAGAKILSEPEDVDVGVRHYRAEDPEGHRWMFSQPMAEERGAVEA